MRTLNAEQEATLNKFKDSFERVCLLYEPASLKAQLNEYSKRIGFMCSTTKQSIFSVIECCEGVDADTQLLLEAAAFLTVTDKVGEIVKSISSNSTTMNK